MCCGSSSARPCSCEARASARRTASAVRCLTCGSSVARLLQREDRGVSGRGLHPDDYNCVLPVCDLPQACTPICVTTIALASDLPCVHARRLLLVLLVAAMAARAGAQPLPEGPIRALDGRVAVSGEVIATLGGQDDEAWFNYTDYEHNALRMMRLGLSASWRPSEWLAFVGEIRSEDFEQPSAYAAYVRVRPWRNHAFDIQAGRIPPTFGAFGRHAYGTDNPVIGYPLAYQYLTSLRTDADPRDGGRPAGDARARLEIQLPGRLADARPRRPAHHRVPMGHRRTSPMEAGARLRLTGAVTNGTLSNPRLRRRQRRETALRHAWPHAGVGMDHRGLGRARRVAGARDPADALHRSQRAFGADVEYSRDHWIVRGEAVWSRWSFPVPLAPSNGGTVGALAAWGEGRYRITPRVFLAGRADRSTFTRLRGSVPRTRALPWDAPVTRIEGGFGVVPAAQFRAASDRRRATGVRPAASTTGRSCRRSSRTGSDADPGTTTRLADRGCRDGTADCAEAAPATGAPSAPMSPRDSRRPRTARSAAASSCGSRRRTRRRARA